MSTISTAAPLVPGMSEATTVAQLSKAITYWQTVLAGLDPADPNYTVVNTTISQLTAQKTRIQPS